MLMNVRLQLIEHGRAMCMTAHRAQALQAIFYRSLLIFSLTTGY